MKAKILFLAVLLSANLSHAKNIYEYMDKVEPLLMSGQYNEADKEFLAIDKSVRRYAIGGQLLSNHYENVVKWLKEIDSYQAQLIKIEANIGQYQKSGNDGITLKGCGARCEYIDFNSIDRNKPRTLPYSDEFLAYINENRTAALEKFNSLNEQISKKEQQDIISYQEEKNNANRQAYNDRLKKIELQKQAISKENDRIDKLSKNQGYSGYAGSNLIQMIHKTQKEGGLENYLNNVVGCHALTKATCRNSYPDIQAIQILDNAVLYSYIEDIGNEYLTFTILVNKEKGKIYQEGQSLKNDYLVFTGMTSYSSVLGATKTVPVFKAANLIDN